MNPALRSVLAVCLVAAPAGILSAREHAPRVLSPHHADAYSLRTFAKFEAWRDLEGDAKAWAVFLYLTDPRTGLYPMGAGGWEGKDVLYEYGVIRDPVKMLNVYPSGYCDTLGPTLEGILEGMGIGPARTVNIPGWGHVACEVFYGGRWHYLDLDVRAAFRRADGSLASVEEALNEPDLWKGPTGPRFFPLDSLDGTREAYRKAPLQYRYGVHTGGHTMDYVLRRGESFTRWWKPQGDRWNHAPSYHRDLRAVLEREPRGPKSKHPSFTVHTRGNGLFLYRPRLRAGSLDLADGAYDLRNVRAGAAGLTLETPGNGAAVFEVRSPYVIAPLVGKFETPDDDREASTVRVEGEGFTLAVSTDGGISWSDLEAPAGGAPIDLTSRVAGLYGYLLAVRLRGEPEKVFVSSLEIATWVQVHPASLPSLRRGKNRLRYLTGDHYGLDTRVVEIRPNASDREEVLKRLVSAPADFDPARKTSRIRGECTVRVKAPPGSRIAWFSSGGSFETYQGADAPRTANAMAWAAEEPRDFQTCWRSGIPAGQSHWHTNADVEVKLDRPAREVFVRYTGAPALNAFRVYAHCLDDRPPPRAPVAITHRWTEGGEPRSKTVRLGEPGAYEVDCDGDPDDESIEIAVPSDGGEEKKEGPAGAAPKEGAAPGAPAAGPGKQGKKEKQEKQEKTVQARFKINSYYHRGAPGGGRDLIELQVLYLGERPVNYVQLDREYLLTQVEIQGPSSWKPRPVTPRAPRETAEVASLEKGDEVRMSIPLAVFFSEYRVGTDELGLVFPLAFHERGQIVVRRLSHQVRISSAFDEWPEQEDPKKVALDFFAFLSQGKSEEARKGVLPAPGGEKRALVEARLAGMTQALKSGAVRPRILDSKTESDLALVLVHLLSDRRREITEVYLLRRDRAWRIIPAGISLEEALGESGKSAADSLRKWGLERRRDFES